MDKVDTDWVRHLIVDEGKTHREISEILKKNIPVGESSRGLSERSVRRFCEKKNLHFRSGLDMNSLAVLTRNTVQQVGPVWGRRMVKGLLKSRGINVCYKRLGACMAYSTPNYHQQRLTNTAKQTNPIPYYAEYFGHKLHFDQNEKLVMYGVTHVCATDGYSGKIVSHAIMPIKNNLVIYENVFRPAVLTHGIWDQIRVDMGKEFYLMLFVQDLLSQYRRNTNRLPYIQTTSKQNHAAERIWVEINSRVNYPVKKALNSMVNEEIIDMDDDVTKFCVSWVSSYVCFTGTCQVIDAWNNHPILGKGIPDNLMEENKQTVSVAANILPSTTQAVNLYQQRGGTLTHWPEFGRDPLQGNAELETLRSNVFQMDIPNFDTIFHEVVNGNIEAYRNAVTRFRDLTYYYSP